ncbi:MAG: hypothetical protein ACAH23_08180 [Nitrososphaeraceae archaeon]
MANSNHCIFMYLKNCESNSGDNNAICTNSSENFLDSIDVSGNNNNINYGLSLSGDNTPIDLDINTKQSNDCDDKSNSDNNLNCMNLQHRIETP